MKTVRNQVKNPKELKLPVPLLKGIKTYPYHFFLRLKMTKKIQQRKVQLKLARKRCQIRKAIFWLSKYVLYALLKHW